MFSMPVGSVDSFSVISASSLSLSLAETDTSPLMEGLYVKVEEDGMVRMRVKFVRSSYTQPNNDKWLSKPIIPNKLNEKA